MKNENNSFILDSLCSELKKKIHSIDSIHENEIIIKKSKTLYIVKRSYIKNKK